MSALLKAIDLLGDLGFFIRRNISNLGHAARLFVAVILRSGFLLKRPRLVIDQILFVGNHSYGSEQALGLLVALSLTRELGPVITALLFAGRAGTSLTAEIGLMKAGEQLSAMEMMAVDPLSRVIAPRLWAGIISMPILATIFTAVGVIGGYFVGVPLIGVDSGAFWSQMQGGVDLFSDIGNGLIKSIVFGVAVTFIALYQGYEARPTPEGVSQATTRTVVISSLAVLALDFLLTAMMFSN